MKGNFMIEKRCKVDLKKAPYVSIKCKRCKGETSIALDSEYLPQNCGVCDNYLGQELIRYIENLKNKKAISSDFEVSIVSIEDE